MIPRPLSDAAARYDPGRWICNKDPAKCDGIYWAYGQAMQCPIRGKCWLGRRNTYEHTPGPRVWGRYPNMDIDTSRRGDHNRRLHALKRKLQDRTPSTAEQRAAHAAYMRELRAKQRAALDADDVAPLKRAPLPCGEDCDGGCPYEACPYTEADIEALEAAWRRDKLRDQARAKHARERARMAADQDYQAHMRELDRLRHKRYYQAKRGREHGLDKV